MALPPSFFHFPPYFLMQPALNDQQRASLALATAYFKAFEHRDLAVVDQLFAEEVVETVPLNRDGSATPQDVFTGKGHVMAYQHSILQNFSQIRFHQPVYTVSADGTVVFFEAHGDFVGTHGNQPYHNVYVFKFTFRDGKIVHLVEYGNPVTFAHLMGLPLS